MKKDTVELRTGAGYDDLNRIREYVLSLPVYHCIRRRYSDLRRALANAREDVQATGTTTSDLRGLEWSIRAFRIAVNESIIAPL